MTNVEKLFKSKKQSGIQAKTEKLCQSGQFAEQKANKSQFY
jgi:hypothetical protein